MDNIFQSVLLVRQSFLQKVFKQYPEENAIIELNNLLASKSILKISLHEITEIISKYKVNLIKTYPKNLYEFYAVYLNHCLIDKSLSNAEIDTLKHLKEILSLDNKVIETIHVKLSGSIYQESVEKAISDGKLDEQEKEFLEKLQKELMLPEEIVHKILTQTKGQFINDFMLSAISDERLSPVEEQEYEALCKNLMVDTTIEEHTKKQLERYKLYWLIDNAELPIKVVPINLQKMEKCYFMSRCDWYEQRTVTKRINYAGPVARVRIMKGVYYRVGSISLQRVTSEEWKHIDRGQLYLTNKRIIFVGANKNNNIRIDKILSFTPYADGIEIDKETGRKPLIQFTDNIDIFGLLLSRLLRET